MSDVSAAVRTIYDVGALHGLDDHDMYNFFMWYTHTRTDVGVLAAIDILAESAPEELGVLFAQYKIELD